MLYYAKVTRSARIVAGRQNDTTKCLVLANDAGNSRWTKFLLTNLNPPNVIGCRHFQDGLNGLAIVVTTVTA